MRYHTNKLAAVTYPVKPTLTDQAAARDTDLNVIVNQFLVHGQMPGNASPALGAMDFTEFPTDLRGFIETARSLHKHHADLPQVLRDLDMGVLLALTPEEVKAKLTPVETNKQDDKPT